MNLLNWFWQLSLLKKILVLGIVVLLGWVIIANITKQKTEPQYQTATATRGTLITSVTSSGTVSSGTNASITTQASGVISEVYVANGDFVNQGDTIATLILDQSSQQKQSAAYAGYLSAQNALNSAKNQMNALQAALFEANRAFVTDAGKENPITDDPTYIIERANWLKAETDYTNQQAVIAQAEAALSAAWFSYAQTSATITSPMSGYVANLSITSGFPIISSNSDSSSTTTSTPQVLGTISLENAKLTATVNLTEIDVTKVKVGQKVTLTLDAFPDKSFTGKVSAINTNGSVSSGVTTYPTTITFDTAPKNIYPNMAVNATIITEIKDSVIIVPSTAIQSQSGESTVRILKNGKPELVTVETGISSDTETEITSGLSEGETVVTGMMSTQTGTQTTSPFGNTGFGGGARGFSAGGATQIRIQR